MAKPTLGATVPTLNTLRKALLWTAGVVPCSDHYAKMLTNIHGEAHVRSAQCGRVVGAITRHRHHVVGQAAHACSFSGAGKPASFVADVLLVLSPITATTS